MATRTSRRRGKTTFSKVTSITVRRDEANARLHEVAPGAQLPDWPTVEQDVFDAMFDKFGLRDVQMNVIVRERLHDLVEQVKENTLREGEWTWLLDLDINPLYLRHCTVMAALGWAYATGSTPLRLVCAMVEWLEARGNASPLTS
jgi:hypothetical protein